MLGAAPLNSSAVSSWAGRQATDTRLVRSLRSRESRCVDNTAACDTRLGRTCFMFAKTSFGERPAARAFDDNIALVGRRYPLPQVTRRYLCGSAGGLRFGGEDRQRLGKCRSEVHGYSVHRGR